MELLSVSLTLCTILTLSQAMPLNSSVSRHMGQCEYIMHHSFDTMGAYVPQCDANGNFLPQQCSGSTRYCWCVNVITGEEIPNTKTPPGIIQVDCYRDFYCPYGWSRFGKRCFTFINSPKTWVEAESYCLFERANLASIHSYEENHFIQALTRGDTFDFPETWIGGFDAIQHSVWMWSDGSKFYYNNWYTDYNVERMEKCLMMNYGYEHNWNYASCNESLPFVCAKRI
ncbi:ladderlectin-like [Thunnus maccoyii]|uniref:ladderlectin-like n=1 Tax=Thunnus maccoyii TaxID=8240 RepID=UPI001C4C532C|nr:ladderlectin-like [Thunnus maccoyii]